MRIALFLDSRHYGGIEAHVYELAKALSAKGHDCEVIFCHDYGPHLLRQQLAALAIPVRILNTNPLQAIRLLAQSHFEVLHTHGYKAGIVGRLAGLLGGFGVCSSYHAGETKHGKLAFYDWLDRLTAPLATDIIAVSDAIAQSLPKRTRIVHNFVDAEQPLTTGTQIAFVGRLSHEKAPDRFLALAKQNPTQAFHLYGDGPMAQALKASAPSNAVFHGAQVMTEHWHRIGLVVMPSRYEGLPLAALEAMSRGIPVIASKAGDLAQLITHQHNGWLIEAHNDDAALSQCQQALQLWQALAPNALCALQKQAQTTITKGYSASALLPQFLIGYYQAAGICHALSR